HEDTPGIQRAKRQIHRDTADDHSPAIHDSPFRDGRLLFRVFDAVIISIPSAGLRKVSATLRIASATSRILSARSRVLSAGLRFMDVPNLPGEIRSEIG